jgi:hypothetical protein
MRLLMCPRRPRARHLRKKCFALHSARQIYTLISRANAPAVRAKNGFHFAHDTHILTPPAKAQAVRAKNRFHFTRDTHILTPPAKAYPPRDGLDCARRDGHSSARQALTAKL